MSGTRPGLHLDSIRPIGAGLRASAFRAADRTFDSAELDADQITAAIADRLGSCSS